MNYVQSVCLGFVMVTGILGHAESPIEPPLTEKYKVDCRLEVFIRVPDHEPKSKVSYRSGKFSFNQKYNDWDYLEKNPLAPTIKWNSGIYKGGVVLPGKFADLPMNPKILELTPYATGSEDGKLSSYQVAVLLQADSPGGQKLQLELEPYSEEGEAWASGSQAVELISNGEKYSYGIELDCLRK